MLTGTVNRLRGQLRIRVESGFPERVLNLCSMRGLAFWDLEWETETAFTCRLSRKDFRTLQKAAKSLVNKRNSTSSRVGLQPLYCLCFRVIG